MSNIFKLDDIRSAANEKYGHYPVQLSEDENDVVTLRNVLQLSEDERAKFDRGDEDDKRTTLETLRDNVRVVADTPEGAERLIEAIGDNLAHFVELIKGYNEATQVGEA